jgi:hypothetical protein
MALVKGPFNLKWGNNVLQDVESVDLSVEQESNDYTTVDGRKFTIKGAISASATITLLASDAASLAPILPQFAKAAGSTMSSGETVAEGKVAIDVLAGDCTTESSTYDLDIESCGNPGEVLRLKACSTSLSSMDLENNQVRTVEITFTGEPAQGIAAVQAFEKGALTPGASS